MPFAEEEALRSRLLPMLQFARQVQQNLVSKAFGTPPSTLQRHGAAPSALEAAAAQLQARWAAELGAGAADADSALRSAAQARLLLHRPAVFADDTAGLRSAYLLRLQAACLRAAADASEEPHLLPAALLWAPPAELLRQLALHTSRPDLRDAALQLLARARGAEAPTPEEEQLAAAAAALRLCEEAASSGWAELYSAAQACGRAPLLAGTAGGDAAEAWAGAGGLPARDADGCYAPAWVDALLRGPARRAGESYLSTTLAWACNLATPAAPAASAVCEADVLLISLESRHAPADGAPSEELRQAGAAPRGWEPWERAVLLHGSQRGWPSLRRALQQIAPRRSLAGLVACGALRSLHLDRATLRLLELRCAAEGVRLLDEGGSPLLWLSRAAAAGQLAAPAVCEAAGETFAALNLPAFFSDALAAGGPAAGALALRAGPGWARWLALSHAGEGVCSMPALLANARHTLGLTHSQQGAAGWGGLRALLAAGHPLPLLAAALGPDPPAARDWFGDAAEQPGFEPNWEQLLQEMAPLLTAYPTALAAARARLATPPQPTLALPRGGGPFGAGGCPDAGQLPFVALLDARTPPEARRLLELISAGDCMPPAELLCTLVAQRLPGCEAPSGVLGGGSSGLAAHLLQGQPLTAYLACLHDSAAARAAGGDGAGVSDSAAEAAQRTATALAVECFDCRQVVTACIVLCELLGAPSRQLRAAVAALRRIAAAAAPERGGSATAGGAVLDGFAAHAAWAAGQPPRSQPLEGDASQRPHRLASALAAAHTAGEPAELRAAAARVLEQLQAAFSAADAAAAPSAEAAPSSSWAWHLDRALVPALCDEYGLPGRFRCLDAHAAAGDWVALLADAQLCAAPPGAVRAALRGFADAALRQHLNLVVARAERGAAEGCAAAALRSPPDLLAVIGACERAPKPGAALFEQAAALRWPLLAVAGACCPDCAPVEGLALWLECGLQALQPGGSGGVPRSAEDRAVAALRAHCAAGAFRRLLEGMTIFLPECPLEPYVRALEALAQAAFPEAAAQLSAFAKSAASTPGAPGLQLQPQSWEGRAALAAAEAVLARMRSGTQRGLALAVLAASGEGAPPPGSRPEGLHAELAAHFGRLHLAWRLLGDCETVQLIETEPAQHHALPQRVLSHLLQQQRWADARCWALAAGPAELPGGGWAITRAEAEVLLADAAALPWLTPAERLGVWDDVEALLEAHSAPPQSAGAFFLAALDAGGPGGALRSPKEAQYLASAALRWLSGGAAGEPPAVSEPELEVLRLRAALLAAAANSGSSAPHTNESAALALLEAGNVRMARAAAAVFGMSLLPLDACNAAASIAQGVLPSQALTPELVAHLPAEVARLAAEGARSERLCAELVAALQCLCPPGGGQAECERIAVSLAVAAHLQLPAPQLSALPPLDALRSLLMSAAPGGPALAARLAAAHALPAAATAAALTEAFVAGLLPAQRAGEGGSTGAGASALGAGGVQWPLSSFRQWALACGSAGALSQALLASALQHAYLPPSCEVALLVLAAQYTAQAGAERGRCAAADGTLLLMAHVLARGQALAAAGEWRAVAALALGVRCLRRMGPLLDRLLAVGQAAPLLAEAAAAEAELEPGPERQRARWELLRAVAASAARLPSAQADGAWEVLFGDARMGLAYDSAGRLQAVAGRMFEACTHGAGSSDERLSAAEAAVTAGRALLAAERRRGAAGAAAFASLLARGLDRPLPAFEPACARPSAMLALRSLSMPAPDALLLAAAAGLRDVGPGSAFSTDAVLLRALCQEPSRTQAVRFAQQLLAVATLEPQLVLRTAERAGREPALRASWRLVLQVLGETGRDFQVIAKARWRHAGSAAAHHHHEGGGAK